MKKELRQDSDLKMRILSREFMDHPVLSGIPISDTCSGDKRKTNICLINKYFILQKNYGRWID